jgi:putative ABC transport system ATP-binding protein
MNDSIVRAEDIHKTYHQMEEPVLALRGISLDVRAGESIAIVGPSGCGKSTFLHMLGALDTPSSGKVFWHGAPIQDWSEPRKTRLRLEKIGFVFQRFYLLPMLTALENVELPMRERGVATAIRKEKAASLMESVNLADRRNHRPSQLSGGEMQRVAIARALANDPQLLLADEPTGELDAATGAEISELFQKFHQKGLTIVMVTHNPELASVAQKVLHMRDGQWE